MMRVEDKPNVVMQWFVRSDLRSASRYPLALGHYEEIRTEK